jgi:hypothetical protein
MNSYLRNAGGRTTLYTIAFLASLITTAVGIRPPTAVIHIQGNLEVERPFTQLPSDTLKQILVGIRPPIRIAYNKMKTNKKSYLRTLGVEQPFT